MADFKRFHLIMSWLRVSFYVEEKKNLSQNLAKNQVSGKFFRSLNLDWVWILDSILYFGNKKSVFSNFNIL